MKKYGAPELRNDFVIVVHKDKPDLACAALSYLFQSGKYLPIFSFHNVEVSLNSEVQNPDIYIIQRRRAEKFGIFLNNVFAKNGKCENLIFLGLTEEQKSYLTFKEKFNVIEIDDYASIEAYLSGFGADKADSFECSSEQSLIGLYQALRTNHTLRIESNNLNLEERPFQYNNGIVGIEAIGDSNTIVAINYAASIEADIAIINPLQKNEDDSILDLIEQWDKGNITSLQSIKSKITDRVGLIDFAKFPFATFFTQGLPYPLHISNIPCSLVNLNYQPDFFLFNAIYSEVNELGGTAAVFSPVFFKEEETDNLIKTFESKNYYLRKLVGKKAQSYNLRNTIEHFPFDILHICSHGGTVSGKNCSVIFQDEHNVEHTIEFYHVIGIAIKPGAEKHPVESLYYFKKLDGLYWRSDELKARKYPHKLYAAISGEISKAFDEKRVKVEEKIDEVPNTNAIACANHFNYFANFDQMGGQKFNPFIFNNSCWSWMKVSTNFLYNGARGYIGTLRKIPNPQAVRFAEKFYEQAFDYNIIDAFYTATSEHLKSSNEPNYIFWGLHFSNINNTKTVKENRSEVLQQLGTSLAGWRNKYVYQQKKNELVTYLIDDINWLINDIISENVPPFLDNKLLNFPRKAKTPLKKIKIGRNDLCPCGSNKKYKNCHGS